MPRAYLGLMYHMVGLTDFLLWEIGAALGRGLFINLCNFVCSLWASEFNLVRLFLANGSVESVLVVIVPVIMPHVIEEHQDCVNGAGTAFMAYFFIPLGVLIHARIGGITRFGVWYPINVSLHSGSHHSKWFLSAKKLPDDETFCHVQKNIWKRWRLSCMNNRTSSGLMKLWALPQGLRV